MKKTRAPFVPKLSHDGDVSRFDKFDEEEPFVPPDEKKPKKVRKDNNFPGFTYNKDIEEQKSNFVKALNESIQIDSASTSGESPHQPRPGNTGAARGGGYSEEEKLTPVVPQRMAQTAYDHGFGDMSGGYQKQAPLQNMKGQAARPQMVQMQQPTGAHDQFGRSDSFKKGGAAGGMMSGQKQQITKEQQMLLMKKIEERQIQQQQQQQMSAQQ